MQFYAFYKTKEISKSEKEFRYLFCVNNKGDN